MGAAATTAVWIRARMCSGMDRKFGAGESQRHGDEPQRHPAVRMAEARAHGPGGCFDLAEG